jgi:4-hydroxy-tetrahydrodipicolinate synthase
MHQPEGIFCALWTAVDQHGQINWKAMAHQLEFVTGHGIHGLMAMGSTGSFYLWSVEQRKKALTFIAANRGERKVPIIVNVSDVSFLNAVQLAEHARSCWVESMAVLPPWYAPVAQVDLAEFFVELVRRVPLPLSLYNYPEVTGKRIEIETIGRVCDSVPLYAFKQSGADFGYHEDLIKVARARGFALVTGADTRLPEAKALGVAGTISGLANAVPDVLVGLWRKLNSGGDCTREVCVMERLGQLMGELPFPLNVRAAMKGRGLETGALVNPVSKGTLARAAEVEEKVRRLYDEYEIPQVTC